MSIKKRNNKTLAEIKGALPGLRSEKVEVISEELERILAIKKLFQSEGGEQLITLLRNNCSVALRKASIAAKKGDSANPFILDWQANMDLLSTVQDISLEKELRDQLDEAVIEAQT
jgi:hypothetical protein